MSALLFPVVLVALTQMMISFLVLKNTQSVSIQTWDENEELECQDQIDKGFFFSPCCGTLFQWSEGSGCSGGPQLDKPLHTDRPDFTSISVTVGKGATQIELR